VSPLGAASRFRDLKLLPSELLITTGPIDHASWNYRGLLGVIQRRRFRLIQALMGSERHGDLLELGFGSGVFAPELASRCERYHGLDVHDRGSEVAARLREAGVEARLERGSVAQMPFADASFDCVVAVSVFEFVDAIEAACREIARVLRPGGMLFVVTPASSALLDLGLALLTGESAQDDFGDRRSRVIPALTAHLALRETRTFPSLPVFGVRLYHAFRLAKRPPPASAPGPAR